MRTLKIFITLTLFIFLSYCQTKSKTENSKKDETSQTTENKKKSLNVSCKIDQFIGGKDQSGSDTGGVFTGLIVKWRKPRMRDTYGGLYILDNTGDTIIFRVANNEMKNVRWRYAKPVDTELIENGKCVKATYKTDIAKIDSIEVNRYFYVTKLEYPE